MKLAGTDVNGTVPVVANTEPEIAANGSGVTVPPGNTGLAYAGVVEAHNSEVTMNAVVATPPLSHGQHLPVRDASQAVAAAGATEPMAGLRAGRRVVSPIPEKSEARALLFPPATPANQRSVPAAYPAALAGNSSNRQDVVCRCRNRHLPSKNVEQHPDAPGVVQII
jgi:hypothetical protein